MTNITLVKQLEKPASFNCIVFNLQRRNLKVIWKYGLKANNVNIIKLLLEQQFEAVKQTHDKDMEF